MSKKLELFLENHLQPYQPVSDVPGIGPKALQQLHEANIKKAAELYKIFKENRHSYYAFNCALWNTHKVLITRKTFAGLDLYWQKYDRKSKRTKDETSIDNAADVMVKLPRKRQKTAQFVRSVPKKNNKKAVIRINVAPTTTTKYATFVDSPLGDKSVIQIPGIGPQVTNSLKELNITKAYQLLGKYLLDGKDETAFRAWMVSRGAVLQYITRMLEALKTKSDEI